MNQLEAVRHLLSVFKITGIAIDYEYDPAGSTTTYKPSKKDMDVIQPFLDEPLTEEHLWFSCGGYSHPHFKLTPEVLLKVRIRE